MALPERLTADQAAAVFRRAAELDGAGAWGDRDAVLDLQALEEIGRDVGLSPSSVRAAVAELRAGALEPAPPVTWGTVISARSVDARRDDVLAALDDEARRNLFRPIQTTGETMVWTRSPGWSAAVGRTLRGRRRHPLLALSELRATVVELPTHATRVRLEGRLVFPSRLLSTQSQIVTVAAVAGGAAIVLVDSAGGSTAELTIDGLGVLTAACGMGIGLHAYRRSTAATEAALDRCLDRLAIPAHSHPRSMGLPSGEAR